jgi:hypothetical protein
MSIGGSVRRVAQLFLAEAILMGIVGGLIGSAFGIWAPSGWGKRSSASLRSRAGLCILFL